MIFKLNPPGTSWRDMSWDWLLKASDGEAICQAPRGYDTEKEARAAIAKFRTKCRGARFARVEQSD